MNDTVIEPFAPIRRSVESCAWDPHWQLAGTRLGIRRTAAGDNYVLAIDSGGASTMTVLGPATGSDIPAHIRHEACTLLAAADGPPAARAYWSTRARCPRSIAVDDYYRAVAEMQIVFGASFRCVHEIWRGDREAIGRVDLTRAGLDDLADYIHHPVFLDSCLQLFGVTLYEEAGRKTFLPVGMESFRLDPGAAREVWSHVTLRKAVEVEDDSALADFVFYDRKLRRVGEIIGFSLKLSDRGKLLALGAGDARPLCYRLGWEALDAVPDGSGGAGPLVVLGGGSHAARLRQCLQGGPAAVRLGGAAGPLEAEAAVIALEPGAEQFDAAALQADAARLLDLVATLELDHPASRLRVLWLVTSATQQVTGHDAIRPRRAFDWGLARTLEREYPQLRVCCIDDDAASDGTLAAAEIAAPTAETMIAFRGGQRYVARIAPLAPADAVPTGPFALRTSGYGSLDNLLLTAHQPAPPAPHEVEIRVLATGLNFKDVLHALGMLEAEGRQSGVSSARDMLFGGDCAGVVTRVGAAVEAFKPGDRVLATLAYGSFASHVSVRADFVAPLAAGLSYADGAAIPTAYLTAYHALVTRAGLRAGERVLIHAAAGGVGLAATQLALHLGARVCATASRSKHAFLRSLGVDHVYDSRDSGFAQSLLEDFPEQVDVVLNSLNGAFIDASFAALRQDGRFVEIGKIGVWTAAQAEARRPDASYALFDLMDVAGERPEAVAREFAAVLRLMADAGLRPVRVQTFPLARVTDAFRCMAQARHIGKIVVTQDAGSQTLRSERTHVVAGGTGALGRAIIGWLAGQGARHIVAIGRRAPDADARHQASELAGRGVVLTFMQADLADRSQAAQALRSAAGTVPLGAIFHLAGVLDDAMLANQTPESFASVLRAKVDVALNLHLASLSLPHDQFVCFSSIAGVFGSAGQANYAAANAVVDALVRLRRAHGLPGLSVNFGPWAQGGMAEALKAADRQRLAEAGLAPLEPQAALAALEQAMAADLAQAIVVDADWSRPAAYPGGRIPPSVAALAAGAGAPAATVGNITPELRALPSVERAVRLTAAITQQLCQVLRLYAADIQPHYTLTDLGLDSLMGMELRHKLEQMMGMSVPIALLLKGPSVSALADDLLALAGIADAPGTAGSPDASARWLVPIGGPAGAAPRLICFHHLGGSADFFRRWAAPLTDAADVHAVQLPGRGQRIGEPPVQDVDALFDALLPALAPLLDRPFIVYGHSMGSHLAYECARRLAARGQAPIHLFASGLWSPVDQEREKHAPHLADGGQGALDIPPALRADANFMALLETLVRADTALLQSYRGCAEQAPLAVPITVFSGSEDMVALPPAVARWSLCTSGAFRHATLPGRHMFVEACAPTVHQAIRAALSTAPTHIPTT